MSDDLRPRPRRPIPALPFTTVVTPGVVRLIAGEDFRYTFEADGLDRWFPALLERCDGSRTLDEAVAGCAAPLQATARAWLERLYGERVLIDGSATEAHRGGAVSVILAGGGALRDRLETVYPPNPVASDRRLLILCQDSLDYAAALEAQRRGRAERTPLLWATVGPMTRAFVGPVFLPDAGPCLGCLIGHFRRLSPAPELYDALIGHAAAGGRFEPARFHDAGIDLLIALVRWKIARFEESDAVACVYRLHVLEAESLEISSHRVFVLPDCPVCGGES